MPSIYGIITSGISNNLSEIQDKLIKTLQWDNCYHFKIKEQNFDGGIFIDNSFSYSKEDFFYVNMTNDIMVLISGKIYNYIEICESCEIIKKNIPNAELVYKSYLKFGENFVNSFNGDFSICVIDNSSRKTLIYRDHLGVSPIAYNYSKDSLLFASDFLALSKVLSTKENINELFLFQELTKNNLWDYKLTPNKQVIKILPGHYIKFNDDGITLKKYWVPEKIKINKKLNIETAISEINAILTDAVKIRCDHRYIASSHVSGGLDSGIVTALARKEYKNQYPFYGFSWSHNLVQNQNIKLDERVFAKEISKSFGIELKFSEISTSDFIEYVSDWRCRLDYFDEFRIRKDAKKLGVNLILSGWGGDEFLSANDRGIDSELLFGLHWITYLKRNSIFKLKKFVSVLLYRILVPFCGRAYSDFDIRLMKSIKQYLALKYIKKGKTKDVQSHWKSRRDVHIGSIYNYHLASRMEEWAICGYRTGIEYRYPLLDKRIVEYFLTIPSKVIYKESRLIMKKLCEDILPLGVQKHTKLRDEVHGLTLNRIMKEAVDTLLPNFEEYRKNPHLSFVNFDLLYDDFIDYKNNPSDYPYLPNNLNILFKIHSIHIVTTNFLN